MRHPASDPMLDRWGLDRANPKVIGCNVYRYSLGGRSLDDIDREFNEVDPIVWTEFRLSLDGGAG